MAGQNSNIPEIWETGFKARQNEQHQCGAQYGVVTHTFFSRPPTHPPVGQKMSLLNFKHKIMTSANYMDGIGTRYEYMSHDKEMYLHSKRFKNYFKINQSN